MEGGLNTYGYVGGNPLVWLDPFGLEAKGFFTFGMDISGQFWNLGFNTGGQFFVYDGCLYFQIFSGELKDIVPGVYVGYGGIFGGGLSKNMGTGSGVSDTIVGNVGLGKRSFGVGATKNKDSFSATVARYGQGIGFMFSEGKQNSYTWEIYCFSETAMCSGNE